MNPESLVGRSLDAITTPAMVVDAAALDHNLQLLAGYFAARPCKLRPHFKSHKCVTLARRQLASGSAVGITCAKLSEAEALVGGGVNDVLVANQVVGMDKARRLAELNRGATVRSAVDSVENVIQLGAAAKEAGVTIAVLIEVNVGMNRCGVAPGQATLDLARRIVQTPGLRLDGLQGYEGHIVTTPDYEERRQKTQAAMGILVDMRQSLRVAGLPCPIVSGGGTGTYDITGNMAGIDEVQAGSYAMMDCSYKKVRPEFRNAMCILATVISGGPDHVVGDVGLKGMGNDFGLPVVVGRPEAKVRYVAEEHVVVDGMAAAVGSRIRVIPSHGCTTSNLHRRMWIIRNEVIEAVWAIEGSGCLE